MKVSGQGEINFIVTDEVPELTPIKGTKPIGPIRLGSLPLSKAIHRSPLCVHPDIILMKKKREEVGKQLNQKLS